MIYFYGKIVEFYTYRSANLVDCFCHIDTDERDHRILKRFITNNGYEIDNHICFKLENGICVKYTDHTILLGKEIKVGYW